MFRDMAALTDEDKAVVARRAQILDYQSDHRHAMDWNQRFWQDITGINKAAAPPGHRDDDVQHLQLIILGIARYFIQRSDRSARKLEYLYRLYKCLRSEKLQVKNPPKRWSVTIT